MTYAQFAKVIDKDGYVNLRAGAGIQNRVIGKIKSGEIIYIFDKGNENKTWLITDYLDPNGILLTGYISKSKLQELSNYKIIPSVKENYNGVNFNCCNIVVEIKTAKFDYPANKKDFSKSIYDGHEIEDKYKGNMMWGTDGSIPNTHYISISAVLKNKKISIPRKEIESLFNINNEAAACYFDESSETLYIQLRNGDGAGTYDVLYIIRDGHYIERKIYNAD